MNKINQTTNILLIVAAAFVVKAIGSGNMVMMLIAIFISGLALLRKFTIQQADKAIERETNGEDSILRVLNKDTIRYADMIEAYLKDNHKIIYEENDGILFYEYNTNTYYATASTLAGARDIVFKLPSDYNLFITYDEVFKQLVNNDFQTTQELTFYNYVYAKRGLYKIPETNLEFKRLKDSDLKIVKHHYSVNSLCTDKYILGRINEGMIGAYINDKLTGFIGKHENNAIGLLEVFDEYKGNNIATLLIMQYVNKLLSDQYKGNIYCQITDTNKVSMHIHQKLLFEKSSIPSYWYFA